MSTFPLMNWVIEKVYSKEGYYYANVQINIMPPQHLERLEKLLFEIKGVD